MKEKKFVIIGIRITKVPGVQALAILDPAGTNVLNQGPLLLDGRLLWPSFGYFTTVI